MTADDLAKDKTEVGPNHQNRVNGLEKVWVLEAGSPGLEFQLFRQLLASLCHLNFLNPSFSLDSFRVLILMIKI